MLEKVWEFFKKPVYETEAHSTPEKISILIKLSAFAVLFSFVLGMAMGILTEIVGFQNEEHAVLEMLESYSPAMIFLLAVIVAPVLEELIFRAPLGLFKKSSFFNMAFYISVFLFGLIHITNFGNIKGYFWLTPILVAPQISAGIFLGYTRVKLGLPWSIILHAAHNLILLGPFIVLQLLDIPFE
ncbi:CPBP family intramembrane glutamic endopeptidase [Costertonia aggregata]|uniref:CPBP family intramembrane metalloprotease n=1 Tax=Costertonia aggregata TaxID=343403 RepID=A0A7H9AUM0_9FLAO|nr:CPBP family intramembrane glutamic endopeptidase [Costertonia aggregata]QLG47097.1 CPBP family intramembrane metalloprotease [Costertonia aggregata]